MERLNVMKLKHTVPDAQHTVYGGMRVLMIRSHGNACILRHTVLRLVSLLPQNTLSPNDMNVKRFHYVDKGIEIGRLTSSPTRGDATSSTYQSGRGKQWSLGQTVSHAMSLSSS